MHQTTWKKKKKEENYTKMETLPSYLSACSASLAK